MKALVIDNNIDPSWWGARDFRGYAALVPGAEFHIRRGPQEDLPEDPAPYDKILITGSKASCQATDAWIENLILFLRRALEQEKHIFGICFGHQILARTLGGVALLRTRKISNFGWSEIGIVQDSPLTAGLPEKFYSFSSHTEEVHALPPESKLLLRSAECAIQGFQWKEAKVFGIQFHPERTLEDAEAGLRQRAREKIPLLNPGKGPRVYNPEIGKKLFRNFLCL